MLNGSLTTQQPQNEIKFVSVNSDTHQKRFEIKIAKDEKRQCENTQVINLNDMNIGVINNDIIKSEAIKTISLENNQLQNIPGNIFNYVPHLSCLILRRNRINIYNANKIGIQHYYLRVLDLSKQKDMSYKHIIIPRSEMNDMEETENVYDHMTFNSSGMNLPNLEHLYLSENDISALLWTFNISFPRLTHLYLTNIYADSLEPTFFDKIPSSLKVLHLEYNQFRNISLKNLMDITAVYLDNNIKLKSIEIFSSKLRILSLSNCFDQLEYVTLNVPYLEQLDLTKNNFYTVTNIHFETYQTLEVLLLDNNKLNEIPFLRLQRLSELSINYNMIKQISSEKFIYLTSLKKLSLRGNEIESIKSDSFLDLKKLEYLNLSENKLRTLPYDWLMPMLSLQYLNFNSNAFANISALGIVHPNDSPNYLKHLFIKNNVFSEISTIDLALLPRNITVYLA